MQTTIYSPLVLAVNVKRENVQQQWCVLRYLTAAYYMHRVYGILLTTQQRTHTHTKHCYKCRLRSAPN